VILEMAKVEILGPRRRLPEVLTVLQEAGVLQLRSPAEAVGDEPLLRPVPLSAEDAALRSTLETALARLEALLKDWPAPAERGPAGALPDVASPELPTRLDALAAERRALDERRARLSAEREVAARYGMILGALAGLRPALPAGHEPKSMAFVVSGERDTLAAIEDQVRRITGSICDLQARELEPRRMAVLLTVPSAHAGAVERLLFESSVEEIELPAHLAGGSLLDAITLLSRRERDLPAEARALDAELGAFAARWRPPLMAARREAKQRLARLGAAAECGQTRHAFALYGWLPKEGRPVLRARLTHAFGDDVTRLEHEIPMAEHGLVPVVLRNRPFLSPFEILLSLVPAPRYGSIDPTPYLAVFFPLLFGLMLGDVGFGLVLLALALLVRRRGWGGPSAQRAAPVAIACAASAILFGILFGEAFGEAGEHLGLRPIVMDRRSALIPSLALALAIGTVHIIVGIVLGIVDAAHRASVRELLLRSFRLTLLVLLPLAIGSFTGVLPGWVAYAAGIAFGALALAALVSGGPLGPIELVLTLGNVLSYARLMALGLASVLLAGVANRLAVEMRPLALGLTFAIFLHAVNFVLGLISPTVCALRLQYVEFFDKFYEEGGRTFRPFRLET
jgi:V/A-type H+-transporting ATPase subunit I